MRAYSRVSVHARQFNAERPEDNVPSLRLGSGSPGPTV